MDEQAPPTDVERETARVVLTGWLASLLEANPAVAAVVEDTETDEDRWFVRVNGEAKDVYSVWFTLGQRTLGYETYVMPAPEENDARFYEQLLRRNLTLRDISYAIGEESAIFLRGQHDLRTVTAEVLDRVLGSIYAAIEQGFQPALRIGFASRFD